MVCVLALNAVDRVYFPILRWSAVLRSKSKILLARNQDNVSEWSDMYIAACCFSELSLYEAN